MRILWLSTSSMQLQPIIESLTYSMRVLFTSVSSMNLEPIVSGLVREIGEDSFLLCRFDKGKEEQFHYEGEVDHVILQSFDGFRPDVVVYSGPAEGKCRPLLSTFHTIRKSAKLVNLVCDGGCPNWHPLLNTYRQEGCFDITVNIDGNPDWPQNPGDITTIGPIDPTYYEKEIQKTVTFGFAGGLGSLERREITGQLRQLYQLTIPERSETWGTYENYAKFMLNCKSVFNMSKTGSGKAYHCKYRVVEAGLAGCYLYEEANPITKKYFVPGSDYIEYENIDHLKELLNLKAHESLRATNMMKQRIKRHFAPEILWRRVFTALGHEIPKKIS